MKCKTQQDSELVNGQKAGAISIKLITNNSKNEPKKKEGQKRKRGGRERGERGAASVWRKGQNETNMVWNVSKQMVAHKPERIFENKHNFRYYQNVANANKIIRIKQ